MTTLDWLPANLHPVAMRLARADDAAYELAELALAWSRAPDSSGALRVRQVQREVGLYDVEVASIRPVPPLAAMLFSEAVHHLRSAVDNVMFQMVVRESAAPLTASQERAVSMLVYDDAEQYESKVKSLVRRGITVLDPEHPLGQRIASVQPFNDQTDLPSIPPALARMMGITPVSANPLALLRDYSNHDKHRSLRLGAGRLMVQRHDDWERSISHGAREISVGTILEQVPIGVPTEIDLSPTLHVQRPDGEWVAPGFELDGMTRHVSDVVIPTLIAGLVLPNALPCQVDLTDNGKSVPERLSDGGSIRAHERGRELAGRAFIESLSQDVRYAPIEDANKAEASFDGDKT